MFVAVVILMVDSHVFLRCDTVTRPFVVVWMWTIKS